MLIASMNRRILGPKKVELWALWAFELFLSFYPHSVMTHKAGTRNSDCRVAEAYQCLLAGEGGELRGLMNSSLSRSCKAVKTL